MLARLLRLFAASGVPGAGVLLADWSPATALALYWVDNLVGAVTMSGRIALHRHWTGRAGHDRGQVGATYSVGKGAPQSFKSFLAEFLFTSIAFTIAQGIFLALVLGMLVERPDMAAVKQGALGILTCQAGALTLDAIHLDRWPFARLKDQAQRVLGRVMLVHMAILGGMLFFAWKGQPESFFAVFIWLKVIADAGSFLPQYKPRDEPPRWLVWFMNLFPKQKGESFEAYWRRSHGVEKAQAERDEQTDGAGGPSPAPTPPAPRRAVRPFRGRRARNRR